MAYNVTGANGENQRLVNTIQLWFSTELGDDFWNHNPVTAKMKANKRILTQGLGLQIVVPLKYPAPGGPTMEGVTDPYLKRSHKGVRGLTRLKMETAELMMPFSIPIRERRLQGSATRRVDVMKSWMERAKDDWESGFIDMLFGAEDSTGTAGAEDTVASILTLINKGNGTGTAPYKPYVHPAQSTTSSDVNGWTSAVYGATPARANGVTAANVNMSIGGINRDAAGYGAYFSCPVWTPTTAATLGRDVINKLIVSGTRNKDTCDLYICQREIYTGVQGILQAQQALQPSKLQDYGFEAFRWNGKDFVYDENVPDGLGGSTTGQIIGVNTKALMLCSDSEEPDVEKGEVDTERPLDEWRILYYCQLVPRMLGRGLGCRHNNITKP